MLSSDTAQIYPFMREAFSKAFIMNSDFACGRHGRRDFLRSSLYQQPKLGQGL